MDTGSTNNEIALAVLRSEEGVDTLDVEQIEVQAYDLGSGTGQNVFVVFGFDEAEPLASLGGAFVGGAQEWRVETFDAETRGGRSEVAGVADVLSPEIWYTLQIVFDGDDVIVNGAEEGDPLEEKVRYTFPNGKPSGLVGLGCSQAESKFDDFRVQGTNIASLAVEPAAKLATQWSALKLDTIW